MILRKAKREHYTVVDNEAVNNTKLSLKAKGLILYLMSKPDGWRIRVTHVAQENKDGKDSIYSALEELREHGFSRTVQVRDGQGRFTTTIEVADFPAFLGAELRETRQGTTQDGGKPAKNAESDAINGAESADGVRRKIRQKGGQSGGFSGTGKTGTGKTGTGETGTGKTGTGKTGTGKPRQLVKTDKQILISKEETPPSPPLGGEENAPPDSAQETGQGVGRPSEADILGGLGMGVRRAVSKTESAAREWAKSVESLGYNVQSAVKLVDALMSATGDLDGVNALPNSPTSQRKHEKAKDTALHLLAKGIEDPAQVKTLAKKTREHFGGPVSYGGILHMAENGSRSQQVSKMSVVPVGGDMGVGRRPQ